jgi:DNA repair protein RadC
MSVHSGHRQRVKAEFLANGIQGWSDHRVLELLLFYTIPQGDVNELAHELIDRFETIAGVLDASPDELKKVPGVGDHTVVLLHLVSSIGGLYLRERSSISNIVNNVDQAKKILAPYFHGARNEMAYVLCLDSKHKFLGVRKISEGSIHAADISIRRVMEEALGLRASAIYLAHNHVSNLAFPSEADWRTTDLVRTALAPASLELIDHLIFVDGDAVSLNESQHGGKRPLYRFFPKL